MLASTPDQVYRLLADAFAAGDIERVMELYEPDAVIVPQPGQVMIGAEQVRAALQGFLDVNIRLSADTAEVIQTGDLALVAAHWSATIDGPDGKPVALGGVSSDILRRQTDGGWRYLVDQPWADQHVKAG
jgi:uncharacterized protein (TIGR02246 family)